MSNHPDPTGLRARRTWWPSAASCAFLASGLEILSFGFWLRTWAAAREHAVPPSGLINIGFTIGLGFTIALIGIAAEARALWGVARRQQAIAPVSARLGQWAFATYVVVSVLVYLLMPLGAAAFGVRFMRVFRVGNQVTQILLTLAFGCLGWASRGDSSPRQRWASGALLVVTMFGVFNVIGNLFGLRIWQRSLWLASLQPAVRAAMWAMVGVWLRGVTVVLPSSNDCSNPNLGTQR